MNLRLFTAQLRAVAAAETAGFVELVKLAGLKPEKDFQYADLSRADLRRQDMRRFNLKHADLRGALIQEALFNNTVSRRQLSEAVAGVPVILIPIGEQLVGKRVDIARHVGEEVLLPGQVMEGLAQLGSDPERRQRRFNAYIGDNTDLARRRLSRHFKGLSRTLKASGAAFILLEPDRDLDFEALSVVQGYLERDGVKAITFILPQAMNNKGTGASLTAARLRALPEGSWINLDEGEAGARTQFYARPTQSLSHLERAREKALGFVWVVANARFQWGKLGRDNWYSKTNAHLFDGIRRNRESISGAIVRAVAADNILPDRHHVFVREDLFAADLGSILTGQLGGQRTSIEVSSYPARAGLSAEYYVVSGGADNRIWSALRLGR